jgi:hypothetical protein
VLGVPGPEAPLELHGGDRVHRMRPPDLVRSGLGQSNVLDLTLGHQLGQRFHLNSMYLCRKMPIVPKIRQTVQKIHVVPNLTFWVVEKVSERWSRSVLMVVKKVSNCLYLGQTNVLDLTLKMIEKRCIGFLTWLFCGLGECFA